MCILRMPNKELLCILYNTVYDVWNIISDEQRKQIYTTYPNTRKKVRLILLKLKAEKTSNEFPISKPKLWNSNLCQEIQLEFQGDLFINALLHEVKIYNLFK